MCNVAVSFGTSVLLPNLCLKAISRRADPLVWPCSCCASRRDSQTFTVICRPAVPVGPGSEHWGQRVVQSLPSPRDTVHYTNPRKGHRCRAGSRTCLPSMVLRQANENLTEISKLNRPVRASNFNLEFILGSADLSCSLSPPDMSGPAGVLF